MNDVGMGQETTPDCVFHVSPQSISVYAVALVWLYTSSIQESNQG